MKSVVQHHDQRDEADEDPWSALNGALQLARRNGASVDEAESFAILLVRVSAPHHAFPQES
jgi:hypothetical protein